MDRLVRGLERLGNNGLSMMLYGSFVRGDYTPGRSDIDAVLTFPHDVIIDKESLHEVSAVLYEALTGNYVPLQVSPLDVTTMRDGRFNSFTDDFYDYFQSEGKVVFGPDYKKGMVCLSAKTGEESALSYNLRKTRQGLLFAENDKQRDYITFLDRFNKALNAASRGSKQILYLADGKLRKNRFSALEVLSGIFPDVDTEPLRRIKNLYRHPEKLDEMYTNPEAVIEVWNSAATFFEEVIRAYIRKFLRKESA